MLPAAGARSLRILKKSTFIEKWRVHHFFAERGTLLIPYLRCCGTGPAP
jgi:hypothetical protein